MKSSGGRIVDIEVAAVAIKADIFIYYNLELNELKKKKKTCSQDKPKDGCFKYLFFCCLKTR